jgi:DNA polymerase
VPRRPGEPSHFIGEGRGRGGRAGKPFVGPHQLLTKIIESVNLRREDVFITNIVKCRPPKNRDPEPDEVAACEPFLKRQLALLAPKVIVALGRHAGSWLAGAPESMAALRTGVRTYEGIRVFPTYHPAALLRNPQWKRPVWEDIQKMRAEALRQHIPNPFLVLKADKDAEFGTIEKLMKSMQGENLTSFQVVTDLDPSVSRAGT